MRDMTDDGVQDEVLQRLERMEQQLLGLDKQIARAGREQFKFNSVAETQASQLTAAMEQLRQATARRDAELATLREQSRRDQAAARLEVVQAILPALDGLDEALRSGYQLLAANPSAAAEPSQEEPAATGWWARLFGDPLASERTQAAHGQAAELRAGLESWLVGLGFVRQRLEAALAAQDVQPMNAVGEPFDPLLHVALEVVAPSTDYPAGSVVDEVRRGYLVGNRVLRHAEVIVAEENQSNTSLAGSV